MKDNFKVLIVEDDEINIKLLQLFLNRYCEDITIVGEAKKIDEFVDKFLYLQPDILLLDIDLGDTKNTLEVLQELGELNCEIIITSSHKEYALKAINEYHVSSYIVKPVDGILIKNAIKNAKQNLLYKKAYNNKNVEEEIDTNVIALPTANTIDLIDVKDILYLEADGKYTVFYMVKDASIVVSKNIGHYESYLPHKLFFRIHHKYIVNLKKIKSIQRTDGNYCLLSDGTSLSIANRRIEKLRKFLHLK